MACESGLIGKTTKTFVESASDPLVAKASPVPLAMMLRLHGGLIDGSRASQLALEAAAGAMAPATKAAVLADLRCFLRWCGRQKPPLQAVPASPDTLVHYLRWLGTAKRKPAKAATLARRLASIARMHRILGFGESEPLPTQAGMVRDTLKGLRRAKRAPQRQAAALRYGAAMSEAESAPTGVTLRALLDSCGGDWIGLRDAALLSLAYDAGLRVSELIGATVVDVARKPDRTGRLTIRHSKTDQDGKGALAWLSPDTMARLSAWLHASDLHDGPLFRRIHVLTRDAAGEGQPSVRHYVGAKALTRQGVVAILRRRVLHAIDAGLIELEPGVEGQTLASLSAHSFRVGLTQDLFAAGEDGSGIALALRWSSPTTALRYARDLAAGSNAAARVLGRVRGGEDRSAADQAGQA